MTTVLPAIIAAVTAMIVAWLTSALTARRESRVRTLDEARERSRRYLSPLRMSLAENLHRLTEVRSQATADARVPALKPIDTPKDILKKSLDWFNGEGAYLASSSYYAACMFSNIGRLRGEIPYLRLSTEDDTVLLAKLRQVSLGYLRNLGVFFATQDSIGELMREEDRVLPYSEYCSLLLDGEKSVWFHRLIQYYLDIAEGQHLERVDEAIIAMEELLKYLDRAAGAGSSINAIRTAEKRTTESLSRASSLGR
ncbi:MAG: hypothetical protein M3Z25_01075 [Actinomycetota bacterium]|nr:hypothetical protein [Actinomycetota bacterium]